MSKILQELTPAEQLARLRSIQSQLVSLPVVSFKTFKQMKDTISFVRKRIERQSVNG